MSVEDNGASIVIPKLSDELIDDMDELLNITPYAKTVLDVFKWAKRKRIVIFLKSLSSATGELDEKSRERFNKIISSEEGAELLSEYVDSVLKTASITANSALAVLYADCNNKLFSENFKTVACYGLSGITDELIELFLSLFTLHDLPTVEEEGPYPIHFLRKDVTDKLRTVGLKTMEDSTCIVYIEELIRRRLLYPDYHQGRIADEGFSIPFGIGSDSMEYNKLLRKAKQYMT